jgi:hypothetical protein
MIFSVETTLEIVADSTLYLYRIRRNVQPQTGPQMAKPLGIPPTGFAQP